MRKLYLYHAIWMYFVELKHINFSIEQSHISIKNIVLFMNYDDLSRVRISAKVIVNKSRIH